MSSALTDSYVGTGQAIAWNRGMSPERMADRAAAYADKEARDQELRTMKAIEPTERDRATMAEQQSVELQNALETQKAMLRENNRQTTFAAYERYDADGDVRHINTMLNDLSKSGSKLYGKIARVDKLTENDRKMLEDIGFSSSFIDQMLTNPELNKSYVKITQKDGTTSFGDVDVLKGLTGYNDYASEKELARQRVAREIEMLATMGYDLDPMGREAFRRTKAELGPNVDPTSPQFQEKYGEIYDQLKREDRRGRGSAASAIAGGENKTEREAEADRRSRLEGYEPGTLEYDRAFSKHMSAINSEFQRPAATRNIEGSEAARDSLEAEGFWDTDINSLTPRERSKWETKVRRIEALSGAALSPPDRTALERIQRLTSLGDLAGELTPEQTGIIDNVLRSAKKYIFDEIEGVKAASAYSAYRNLVQHALYGAALTPNEQKNFEKQFGSLAQQRGPVLAQLRVTMQELLDVYEAVARTNDPIVMAWRTGKTEAELMDVIESLDERIKYIDSIAKGETVPYTTIDNPPVKFKNKVELTPEKEAKLKEIFGEGR